jgi:hypothetical protein
MARREDLIAGSLGETKRIAADTRASLGIVTHVTA